MSHNDGSIPANTDPLTLSNGVTYQCESFEVSRPSNEIRRKNSDGTPGGSFSQDDFVTFTATLQIPTNISAYPTNGLTFSRTVNSAYGSESFYINSVGTPESIGADKKVNISGIKIYN